MIVWQVNWSIFDSHHKLFVLAKNKMVEGSSKKSNTVCTWNRAKTRGKSSYYFYMEFIK